MNTRFLIFYLFFCGGLFNVFAQNPFTKQIINNLIPTFVSKMPLVDEMTVNHFTFQNGSNHNFDYNTPLTWKDNYQKLEFSTKGLYGPTFYYAEFDENHNLIFEETTYRTSIGTGSYGAYTYEYNENNLLVRRSYGTRFDNFFYDTEYNLIGSTTWSYDEYDDEWKETDRKEYTYYSDYVLQKYSYFDFYKNEWVNHSITKYELDNQGRIIYSGEIDNSNGSEFRYVYIENGIEEYTYHYGYENPFLRDITIFNEDGSIKETSLSEPDSFGHWKVVSSTQYTYLNEAGIEILTQEYGSDLEIYDLGGQKLNSKVRTPFDLEPGIYIFKSGNINKKVLIK